MIATVEKRVIYNGQVVFVQRARAEVVAPQHSPHLYLKRKDGINLPLKPGEFTGEGAAQLLERPVLVLEIHVPDPSVGEPKFYKPKEQ